jgi:ribosome maturation factor RimP
MKTEEKIIEKILLPEVQNLGYRLMRVKVLRENNLTLQIMIDRYDKSEITVEDCEIVSRTVSPILDIDCPIGDEYFLEVSSPGIDRPLISAADFDNYSGFDVRIEMSTMVDGRKRFKGKLMGLEKNMVKILVENVGYKLPYDDIFRAKLILTQELLDV